MRWLKKLFGSDDWADEGEAESPEAPRQASRWAQQLDGLTADGFAGLLAELQSEDPGVQLDILRRARELIPRHVPLQVALARLGESEAHELWRGLSALSAHAPEALAWLIDAALGSGDRAEAARLSQRALVLAPGDAALLERALDLRDGLPLLPPPAAPTAFQGAPVLAPAPERVPPGFTLVRRLGAGGFGVVYEAVDDRLERTVALKFLHAHLGSDRAVVAAFGDEARSMAELDLPGVVRVFDVYPTQQAIALEFCGGGSLQDRLDVVGPMPRQASALLAGPARTLAKAHAKGVVHGDLKPANLLFREAELVLTDFGAGTAGAGTEGFRAPEQTTGAPDAAWDVYALGKILAQLLGPDAADRELVSRATQSDPTARPSMAEVTAALA